MIRSAADRLSKKLPQACLAGMILCGVTLLGDPCQALYDYQVDGEAGEMDSDGFRASEEVSGFEALALAGVAGCTSYYCGEPCSRCATSECSDTSIRDCCEKTGGTSRLVHKQKQVDGLPSTCIFRGGRYKI